MDITLGEALQGGGLLAFAYSVLWQVRAMRMALERHMDQESEDRRALIEIHRDTSQRLGSIDAKLPAAPPPPHH